MTTYLAYPLSGENHLCGRVALRYGCESRLPVIDRPEYILFVWAGRKRRPAMLPTSVGGEIRYLY